MGHMKDLDRRIRQGGDDAIAAVSELLPRWIPVSERLPEDGEAGRVRSSDSGAPEGHAAGRCAVSGEYWRTDDSYGVVGMTLPNERTRAVFRTKKFLGLLASPYNGGFKRIPKEVREQARRLLRHYPLWFDLGRADCFDAAEAARLANEEET